jgi:hypothetical protein
MVYFMENPSMDDDWGYIYGYLHDLSESPIDQDPRNP